MHKTFKYLSLFSILFVISLPIYGFEFSNPYKVYNAAYGSELTFNASDIDGISSFDRKTTFYLTKTKPNGKNGPKKKLNLLSYDTDSATVQVKKHLPAGVYELWVRNRSKENKSEPVMISNNFEVRPPSIHELEGDLKLEDGLITLTGNFFSSRKPKVWVQYTDTESGKIIKIRAKVDKKQHPYISNGKVSPMHVTTGSSELTFILVKIPPENAQNIQIHCSTGHGKSFLINANVVSSSSLTKRATPEAGKLISACKLNESTFETVLTSMEQNAKSSQWWEYIIDVIELLYENRLYSTLDCYQLIYYTENALGGYQVVSGVVFIPKTPDTTEVVINTELPILSMQHGTNVERADSPSLNLLAPEDIFAQLYAWKGYIVPMADYPGMGINHDQQPYCNFAVTNSVVDMLKATKEFLANHYTGATSWNGKLGLIGYSEGGYVTMGTGKILQENYSTEFPVTACAPLEGPYSLSDTMLNVMRKQAPFKSPYFLPTILNGYDAVYKNETHVFSIFNSVKPSVEGVPSGYNTTMYDYINGMDIPQGETVVDSVNSWMAKAMQDPAAYNAPRDVLSDEYAALMDQDSGIVYDKLYENDSFRDWIPSTMKLKMFHCVEDDLVPVGNEQVAYQAFLTQGASTDYLQTSNVYSIQLLLDLFEIIDEKLLQTESIHVINAPFGFMKGIEWMDEEILNK